MLFPPPGDLLHRTDQDSLTSSDFPGVQVPSELKGLVMNAGPLFGGRPVLEFQTNTDRRSFLKWAGLVGVGASLVAGGLLEAPGTADAQEILASAKTGGDIDILNFALVLEYLELDFYRTGLGRGLLKNRDLELVTAISDHETQHVAAVTAAIKTLGGTPIGRPKFNYPVNSWLSRDGLLKNASTLEELGVSAYQGQVPLIKSADVLAAGAAIAGVESRHASVLATLVDRPPFPSPIEEHRTKSQVWAVVKPLMV
jgi:rubrerythrin